MQFSQPAFLWGLLAVAIPILIHLINLRRYRKVYFSNVDRLTEMQTEQRRRSRLREWLILAARVLAVALLVLAFAQPVLPSREGQVRSGTTAVSIYVDNSFSMQQADAEGSVLDQALRKAREVAEAYGVGDRFQLITNDMTGSQMRLTSRDELFSALDEVQPSAAAPLMSTVARRQRAFLRQSGARTLHAYIISDFQRTTADLDALPADSAVLTTLLPLAGVRADNLFIDTLRLDAPAYFVGGSVSVEATLCNSGSHDMDKVPLRLVVDGRERAVTTVDLPAGATVQSTLHFTLDRSGDIDGMLAIEDYPVTFDDRYHFSLRTGDPVRMLEIDAARPNGSLAKLFGNDSTVRLATATHLQHDLADFDFVVLDDLRTLSSGEAQQLARWVSNGGSLLVVPAAEGCKTDEVNALLAMLQAPQLDRWTAGATKAATVNTGASLYRGVFHSQTADMEMPAVQGHYRLGRAPHLAQDLITLADGTPLLSVTTAGTGRLYLFTAPLSAEVNSLVGQALFVPTLYNMALYSRPVPPASYTLGTADPILLADNAALQRQPQAELLGPDGFALLPDVRRAGSRQLLTLHGELTHDGIYTLAGQHLAFNYPRRESRMDFMAEGDVADAIKGRQGLTLMRHAAKPLTERLRNRDAGRPLWRLCLVLALLMLGLETLLIKTKR